MLSFTFSSQHQLDAGPAWKSLTTFQQQVRLSIFSIRPVFENCSWSVSTELLRKLVRNQGILTFALLVSLSGLKFKTYFPVLAAQLKTTWLNQNQFEILYHSYFSSHSRSPWKISLNDDGSLLAVLEDTLIEIYQRDHFQARKHFNEECLKWQRCDLQC